MKLLTFRGGIHPPYKKEYSNQKAIEKAENPKVVYIPLQQHIGAPASPIVQVGDSVKVGQKIGEQQGFVSCNVHSSVSGKVVAIKECEVAGGTGVCVVIENDFLEEKHESVKPKGELDNLTKEEIVSIIKEAGIVGMGGATFPTHVKLSPPPDKNIDVVILNGAECEPYLTADHRLMLENPEDVVFGLKVFMKALNVKKGYIGIEVNKPDALDAIQKAAQQYKDIEVVGLEIKYPQGAEKQLIYACTGREVPSGGLPMDAGAVVNNVGTAAQVARTIKTGMPLIERITTVTGSCIKNPKNLITKVGTLVSEIIEQCEGFKEDKTVGKVIMGGPMMGIAQYTIDIPTNKGTSGILCLDEEESKTPKPQNCLRCGKCLSVCPAFLQPLYISAYSLKNDFENAQNYRALDCIECGSCSFVCPARRPLLQSVRNAKREIIANKRKQTTK
ncbi:electron transport complex subunit RsxC [Romboutsia lituseburensis]|uniref:Ion-translocating oxidoreductase complex subunit C n=1 Tax=Romboutsia lituseburensis DSM 797 TaxID=1121325 RepID=A0A1G9NTY5_9FIRM|nr:electron transport complex subunit RsxC [Romboutsia lituseburensis]CEH33101.1 Electron transport complex protein rnfC [Romboutsia lituseburensis]SDL89497.1 electron transport complex protein RnfC [Romboutsia lituseburensis DSM 797]